MTAVPLPTTELLIVDADGERMGPDQVGQIYIRNLLGADFEYWGDREKTDAAHLEPGVFTVGDVGYVDEDGFLFLSDRKIDMIISGGVNICARPTGRAPAARSDRSRPVSRRRIRASGS